MKTISGIVLLALSVATPALAADYTLKAGSWQIEQDIGINQQVSDLAAQSFCVKASETHADTDWIMTLAKPSPDCSARLVSETQNTVRLSMSCPADGHELKGPSTVTLGPNEIVIQNDLVLDLPYSPLPMAQTRTARHVSNRCE